MTYPNQIYSAFSFIGFLLCAIPFYWQLEAWNVGTSLYIAWAGLGCLNLFINSVLWNSTVENFAPIWCDISTRFVIGSSFGISTSLLVINRRLFKILSRTAVFTTGAERRRALVIDLAIGLGIPLLQMALQLVVEGHRFDIYEEIGCMPNTYNVTLAFPLVYIWPAVINMITCTYCVLTIRLFWKSSQQLKEIQASNNSSNQRRYMRLIAMSVVELLFILPATIYLLYVNIHVIPVEPWISWEDTHFDYSNVIQVPSVVWQASPTGLATLEYSRWLVIACAFVFFAFFGFGEEARKHYRLAYSCVSSRLRFGKIGTGRADTFSPSRNSRFRASVKRRIAGLSFKSSFLPLASRRGPDSTMEHKVSSIGSSSVSEYRLTSTDSVLDGQLKASEIVPEDFARPSPLQTTVITLPTAQYSPAPPQPAIGAMVLNIPSSRLNSPLPPRPVSFDLDPSEKV